MPPSKKQEIENLLYDFPDHLGELWDLQQSQTEINFNLYPLLTEGGENGDDFICIRPFQKDCSSIFFSNALTKLIPNLKMILKSDLSPEELNFSRDFSYRLQIRQKFLRFCLLEGEIPALTLLVNGVPLKGHWRRVNLNEPYKTMEYVVEMDSPNLTNLLSTHQKLNLHIQIKPQVGALRDLIEQELNIDRTVEDCWQVFYKLINLPELIKEHFHFYNNLLFKLKVLPELTNTPDELINKVKNLSKVNVKHLDFFDWTELLAGFSFTGDFGVTQNFLREMALKNIKLLQTTKTWPLGLSREYFPFNHHELYIPLD